METMLPSVHSDVELVLHSFCIHLYYFATDGKKHLRHLKKMCNILLIKMFNGDFFLIFKTHFVTPFKSSYFKTLMGAFGAMAPSLIRIPPFPPFIHLSQKNS